MLEGAAFRFIKPHEGFHLRLPDSSLGGVIRALLTIWGLVNFHSYLSFAVWHWSKDSAFSSSSEASGLDPSSPLCYSILDVPAVCSELDWHPRSPPHCPSRFCQTRASPVHLPAADSAGLPSARLPALGKQQFEFCLLRLTEL